MQPKAPISISNVSKRYVTTGTAFPPQPIRNSVVTEVRNTNMRPVGNSIVRIEGKPQMILPGNMVNTQNYRRVIINPTPQVLNNNIKQSGNIERF